MRYEGDVAMWGVVDSEVLGWPVPDGVTIKIGDGETIVLPLRQVPLKVLVMLCDQFKAQVLESVKDRL